MNISLLLSIALLFGAPLEPGPPAPALPVEPALPDPEPPAPIYDPVQLQEALTRLPPGPSLAELQDAALAEAGVDPHAAARWLRRARMAAALPTVSVQYDRRFDRKWTLAQEVGEADALRNDSGNQDVLRTKATWDLDRLIFTPEELRAARAVLDVADFRERLLVEITQLYFERERILLERELAPPTDLEAAIAIHVRLREIEGLLTGLTGLDFTPPSNTGPRSRPRTRQSALAPDLGDDGRR